MIFIKHKKVSFSILEQIEIKKMKQITLDIRNMYLKKKENDQQLQLLIEYEKEYITKINNYLALGFFVYKWNHYNNFIAVLNVMIKHHRTMLEENKKLIDRKIITWFQSKKKIKIWQYLNGIHKKERLKIKKIQKQLLHDFYIQLKFLTQGQEL